MEKEYKFSISEVSSKTNISTSAINYYVRSNLITPPKKTAKTRAFFSKKTIDELIKVKELKSKGLPIKMIKQELNKNKKAPKYTSFTGSIKKLSEELSMNQNWIKQIIKTGLVTAKSTEKNVYFIDSLDIQLLDNLKKMNSSGIPEEYLIRHSEYTELSKAESTFLLEHINFSNFDKDAIKSIHSGFEKVRNILRIKELNKLLS
jgi:DNA-binding transcriptional MerR regulator